VAGGKRLIDPATTALTDRLLAGPPRLELDAWTLGRPGLEALVGEIGRGRRRIAECGCGLSTVLIARLLSELGGGSLHALEHDDAWARLIRTRLAAEGLAAVAEVIDAPLAAHPLAPPGCRWYAPEAIDRLPSGIELLLIDGPPAGESAIARSRYPAIPALRPRLAEGATVILDDAEREGERWALSRWESESALSFDRRAGHGLAIGVFSAQGPEGPKRIQREG
jgi:hypothetical protein